MILNRSIFTKRNVKEELFPAYCPAVKSKLGRIDWSTYLWNIFNILLKGATKPFVVGIKYVCIKLS